MCVARQACLLLFRMGGGAYQPARGVTDDAIPSPSPAADASTREISPGVFP